VPALEQAGLNADLDDPDARIVEVFLKPIGRDQRIGLGEGGSADKESDRQGRDRTAQQGKKRHG